VASADSEDALS